MNRIINKWYKNHALIYKVILFLSTTFFIVYLFPKSGKFKYSFDKGKPWQSESLYAPFNFAVKKTKEELDTVIDWLTGYNHKILQKLIDENKGFSDGLIINIK